MMLAAAPLEFDCNRSRLGLLACSKCRKFVTELFGVVNSLGGVVFAALIDKSNPFARRNIATANRLLNP